MAAKVYDLFTPKVYAEQFASPLVDSWTPAGRKSKQFAGGVCEKLRSALSGLFCESLVVTLTLVSALAIAGEMLVDYGILRVPSDQTEAAKTAGESASSQTQPNGNKTTSHAPKTSEEKTMDLVQDVFHYISLAIACLFFLEIALKLVAFRMKFLLKPWQVLDMLIVVFTLMVEVAFEIKGRIAALEACTFLVVFRLWRLPHDCNIKARAIQRDMEQEIKVWKAGNSKLEDKCKTLETRHSKQKEKSEHLERELANLMKEKQDSRSTEAASVPNGSVPRDTKPIKPSSKSRSPKHVNKDNKTRGMAGTLEDSKEALEKSDRERETEEVSAEEGESKSSYFWSGSESSLSCQALEQEVQVQIEGQGQGATAEGESSKGDGGGALLSPVREATSQNEDKDTLITEPSGEHHQSYQNMGYMLDADEETTTAAGILMYEIDGSRTYRSAEGIPMTDL